MKRTALLIAALLLLAGCHETPHRYNSPIPPLLSQGKEQLYRHFDREVIVTGKAEVAAKEGVVVVMDDGTRVMIPEMQEWPRRAAGKRVSVSGMLERVPTAVQASAAENGPIPDDRFLLKGVRWKVGRATTGPS